MSCNVGGWDRAGRAALGTAALAAGATAPKGASWRPAAFVVAGVAYFTVATRYCPLNSLLGIDTCERPESEGPLAAAAEHGRPLREPRHFVPVAR